MRVKGKGSLLLGFAVCASLLFASAVTIGQRQQQRMKRDEWTQRIATLKAREAATKDSIQAEDKAIAALRSEIAGMDAQIASLQQQIFDSLKIQQRDVATLESDEAALRARIQRLEQLPDADLAGQRALVDSLRKALEAVRAKPSAMLEDQSRKLEQLGQQLGELVRRAETYKPPAPPAPDTHAVVKGEYLWLISSYKHIYAEGRKWPRIYRANRDKIKDPDLIYPGQVFVIPRGYPTQHIVVNGEWLAKIAGYWEIYNDWSKWPRIYEANRDKIKDPDLIYPNQVFAIPRD